MSYNPIDGNPGQTGINFTIDSNGNTVGFIHSHFDKPNMSPIFTIEDVRSFNAIDIYRGIKRKSRTNTCLMLVSRAGVFALVIEDFTLMKNYGDKLHDPIEFEELKMNTMEILPLSGLMMMSLNKYSRFYPNMAWVYTKPMII